MKKKKKQPKKATKKQSLRVVALQSSGPHVVEPGKVPKVMSNLLKTAKTLGEMQKKKAKKCKINEICFCFAFFFRFFPFFEKKAKKMQMKSKTKAKGKALPDRIGNRNGKPQRRQETPNALCMLFGFAFLLHFHLFFFLWFLLSFFLLCFFFVFGFFFVFCFSCFFFQKALL